MLVNIVFNEIERDWDIVDIPDILANSIESIHRQFVDWVYDEANNSRFMICMNDIERHVYELDDFLEWLNARFAQKVNGEAKIVSRNAEGEIDFNNPTIYF